MRNDLKKTTRNKERQWHRWLLEPCLSSRRANDPLVLIEGCPRCLAIQGGVAFAVPGQPARAIAGIEIKNVPDHRGTI